MIISVAVEVLVVVVIVVTVDGYPRVVVIVEIVVLSWSSWLSLWL